LFSFFLAFILYWAQAVDPSAGAGAPWSPTPRHALPTGIPCSPQGCSSSTQFIKNFAGGKKKKGFEEPGGAVNNPVVIFKTGGTWEESK